MQNDKTIIYYTANQECPVFEEKITRTILKNSGGLPIVSVSQKPMAFGKNICVGNVGRSYDNVFRQTLIACKEAKTKYVISTESDCLYPPDYFAFTPTTDDIYRYDNVWVLKFNRSGFFKKCWLEGAQVMPREMYIEMIERMLKDLPMWNDGPKKMKNMFPHSVAEKFKFFTGQPVIDIKTEKGLRVTTWTDSKYKVEFELPYWGSFVDVVKEYLL